MLLNLRCRLKQLRDDIAVEEESLKTRLEAGAVIEPGDHTAELKENFRRNVAWKAVVIRLAARLKMDGEAYCGRIISATKPTRTISLVVPKRLGRAFVCVARASAHLRLALRVDEDSARSRETINESRNLCARFNCWKRAIA